MKCPHCNTEITRKIHWLAQYGGDFFWAACGSYSPHGTEENRSLVTCLSCKRTKRFKEAQ